MSSTSPTSRKPWSPSWNGLSPDIRLIILESLMDDGYPLSRIVTVSREWQEWIEPRNFARLRLTPSRLLYFSSMVYRNRAHVRYIWFYLELPEYNCVDYYDYDYYLAIMGIVDTVPRAFKDLFQALSTLEPHGHLTLDIGFYSPSDVKHWFPYLTFMPDTPSAETRTTSGTNQAVSNTVYHDIAHGWVTGSRQSPPPGWGLDTMFDDCLDDICHEWWGKLPTVPAIARVLLRQQNYRRLSPGALAHMFASFPRLQEVHYELWREFESYNQERADQGLERFIESLATHNKMLKKLVLFENFNQQYPRDIRLLYPPSGEMDQIDRVRKPTPAVSQAVAVACLELEHVAASFLVDASQFFSVDLSLEWRKLISLRLTSGLLTPDADPADVKAILQAAAAAIVQMPLLETMEIWNGRKGLAGLFRYHAARKSRRAIITWRGTWRLNLESSVTQAWETAVAKLPDSEDLPLFWVQEEVDVDVIKSHGDAIHHLKLSDHVIRPVSLQQILREQDALKGVPTDD